MKNAYGKNADIIHRKPKPQASSNASGALVLVIFAALCLVMLGALSFQTAFADKKLTDRNLQNVTRYYEADAQAEKTLALVYSSFIDDGFSPDNLPEGAAAESADAGAITVSFSVPIDDVQTLLCRVLFSKDSGGKISYNILSWRSEVTAEMDYSGGTLNVWPGE